MATRWTRETASLSRGTVLIAAGLLLLVSTLVVSAALAPSIGATSLANNSTATLVGSQGGGPAWHEHGSVYLIDNDSSIDWRESSADSYFDVTKMDDGTVVAAFVDGGYSDCGPFDSPCPRTGFKVIDPRPTPTVVHEYSYPVRTMSDSEVHDVEPLGDGEFLVADMEYERLMAVRNDSVTWQWNASSFYDAPPDPTTTDWLHINDVDVLSDDRYLVSVRNANQLLVIERDQGVVEVVNADDSDADDGSCRSSSQLSDYDDDGEIRCGDPTVLNHQHNPQWLGEGRVLVADSDNDRVVELERTGDEQWTPVWTRETVGDVALNWPRDADRLPNGHTLITDTLNRRLVEIDADGEVVWSVRTERIPYEADRLPFGEPVGGPASGGAVPVEQSTAGDVPVLSVLLLGIRGAVPATPFWFAEPQLALTLVSLGLVVAGVVSRIRGYRRSR